MANHTIPDMTTNVSGYNIAFRIMSPTKINKQISQVLIKYQTQSYRVPSLSLNNKLHKPKPKGPSQFLDHFVAQLE